MRSILKSGGEEPAARKRIRSDARSSARWYLGPSGLAVLGALACGHTADVPADTAQQASTLKGYPNLAQKVPAESAAVPSAPAAPTTPTVSAGSPTGPVATASPSPSGSAPVAARPGSDEARPTERFWPPRGPMAAGSPGAGAAPIPMQPDPQSGAAGPSGGTPALRPYVQSNTSPATGPTAASASYPYPPYPPSSSSSSPSVSRSAPYAPPSRSAMERQYDRPLPLAQGPRYTVRGVDRSDVLNVRSAPGSGSPVVGQIPPDTRGVLVTGARRAVGSGYWREVSYGDVHGWVNEKFLVEERD